MKIPKNPEDREQFYMNLVLTCFKSKNSRIPLYQELRNYYLFGTSDGSLAPFNKIQPTIQLLKSFIYSAETTKFNLQLGNTVPLEELKKVKVLNEEINETWHDSNIDIQMGQCVEWAYIFGSMIVKINYDKNAKMYLIDPGNFGVINEQEPDLTRQEAVCQMYTIPRSEFERIISNHPNKDYILASVRNGTSHNNSGELPDNLKRLVITSSGTTISGNVDGGMPSQGTSFDYNPTPLEESVAMYELYVFNDDINDYQIVTIADPGVIIYDRANFLVSGYLPFVKICPEPLPFYFWGQSFLAKLTPIQDWYTTRIAQMKELLDKQVNPPTVYTTMSGLSDDKYAALRVAGGYADIGPNGTAKSMAPDIPSALFQELGELNQWFAEMSGVNHLMQGQGEAGVRSHGQTNSLIRLSSARPRQAALVIEDALEQIAGMILRLKRCFSDKVFSTTESLSDGTPLTFTIGQFTNDFVVKVDSHSSSPIFVEDKKMDAQVLFKAQCIDRIDFLRMYDPPGVQDLEYKLRERISDEKKQREMQMQMEQQKVAQASGRPASPGDQKGPNDLKNERSIGESGGTKK